MNTPDPLMCELHHLRELAICGGKIDADYLLRAVDLLDDAAKVAALEVRRAVEKAERDFECDRCADNEDELERAHNTVDKLTARLADYKNQEQHLVSRSLSLVAVGPVDEQLIRELNGAEVVVLRGSVVETTNALRAFGEPCNLTVYGVAAK